LAAPVALAVRVVPAREPSEANDSSSEPRIAPITL